MPQLGPSQQPLCHGYVMVMSCVHVYFMVLVGTRRHGHLFSYPSALGWILSAHQCTLLSHTGLLPAGAHYYCESLDITRPFPSVHAASEPSWPFVWNKALSSPLRLTGLDGPNLVCPALLQVQRERAYAATRYMCLGAASTQA